MESEQCLSQISSGSLIIMAKEKQVRSLEEIKRKIESITRLAGQGVLGRVKSPRAHSKIMALEWVIREREDLI